MNSKRPLLQATCPIVLVALLSSYIFLPVGRAQDAALASVPTDLFVVPEGLEVTVWATTPMFFNPTNMDFDKDGRLWVTEGVNYRSHSKRKKEGDRVVVMEDTDGDGKADENSVFVQEATFIAPLGVGVLDNQILVSQPPDLIAYTDVNGDRKFDPAVDKREVLLTGFNGRNHDHSLHSVTAGPDGLWYWNQGNTGAQFTDKSGKTFRIGSWYADGRTVVDSPKIAGQKSDDGHVYVGGFAARMNPDGSNVQIIGHNFRNSYEQAITSMGDVFQSDNDDPPACRISFILEYGNAGFSSRDGKRTWHADRRPGQDVPTSEWRQEDPGTMPAGDIYGGGSPTGVAFYENGVLGDKWRGLLLACDAGRNVVFGYLPKPDGAGFKLERFDFATSNKEKKFSGSDFLRGKPTGDVETLFRPSDVIVGPDGAIYVADWFDKRVGGHADMDGTTSGTIYRIAPKGFKSRVPKIDLTSTAGQIAALKSPAVNARFSGFTRLKAAGASAVPAVAKLLGDPNPFIASRAVWLLAQMGPQGVARVTPFLKSKSELSRLVAYRALRRADRDVLAMAASMASDPSAAVRREVALTMRDVPIEQSRDILITIAKGFDGKDRTYLEAFGTGCEGKEEAIYAAISMLAAAQPEQWSEAYAWLSWRLHPPAAVAGFKARALATNLPPLDRRIMLDALAFVKTPEAALAMVDLAATEDFPLKENAVWWLNSLKGRDWKEFGVVAAMKERGLIKEKPLVGIVSIEPTSGPSKFPPVTEVAALEGDAKRGETALAACVNCHKIAGKGSDFGPDLTAFGKTQGREVIINAILNPSSEISHGYEGQRIETNDGVIIDGIVADAGNPVVIKSMGGQNQSVPRDQMKSLTPLKHSLMWPAETMGITAQSAADIATYLKSIPQ